MAGVTPGIWRPLSQVVLTAVAIERRVSAASTQNQAPQPAPVVLTRRELHALLALVSGTEGLVLHLLYGTGLRRRV